MKTIRVRAQSIYILLLMGLILFDFSILFNFPSFLKVPIVLFFLLMAPGILFFSIVKTAFDSIWEKVIFALGISIAFCMFFGFTANWIFPLINIFHPLTFYPLLYACNLLFSIALFIGYIRSDKSKYRIHIPHVGFYSLFVHAIPFLFPFLGALSAISVNNGGFPIFTFILLGSIGAFVMLVSFFHKRTPKHVFPISIFCISLGLLFMTSLRGWYITGHDIQREFYVFELAKRHGLWDMNFYKDAYNSCLSITILPTILSTFLPFQDDYIYKVIFQIIFAFVPVAMYLFVKRFSSSFIAYLATFYFIAFPTFFNDMPMLNRQEIGFLFFFLLFYVLFNERLSEIQKFIFGFLFGAGMVVSHYSTTYVAVALLGLTVILRNAITLKFIKKIHLPQIKKLAFTPNAFSLKPKIPWTLALVLLLFTFYWNSLLTKTSGDFVKTITGTFGSIHSFLKEDTKSSDVSYSIFFPHAQSDKDFVNAYVEKSQNIAKMNGLSNFYPANISRTYAPIIISPAIQRVTKFGIFLEKIHLSPFSFNSSLRSFSAKWIQIIIFIGLLGLLYFKTKEKYPLDYVLISFLAMCFIFLMLVLPQLSINYGLLRLFEQMLFVLGLPAILGNMLILSFVKQETKIRLVTIIAVFFFLNISGFISNITGGYLPQLNFSNMGIYYDAYFVHKSEVVSSLWLSKNIEQNATVQADGLAANRLFTFGNVDPVTVILPWLVEKNSYVYLSNTNTFGKSIISVDRLLYIDYPTKFLDENKSHIYNNGSSQIYK